MPFDEKQHITALLLAGGRSERLGGIDKGLLRWHGIPLAEHVLRRVAPQVGSMALSYNRNRTQYHKILEKYSPRRSSDSLPALLEDSALPQFAGPLAGIFSMLQLLEKQARQGNKFRCDYLFVCCCDMPRLPPDLVDTLLNSIRQGGHDAVYPLVDQNHMRLTLLLRVQAGWDAHARWQAAGASDLSVKNWLRYMKSKALEMPDRDFGANVNRHEDLALLDDDPLRYQAPALAPSQD